MGKRPDQVFFENIQFKKATETPVPAEAPTPVTEPGPRPITQKNLFSNHDAHPVALDYALLKHFKLEWFTWLPDVLFHEIEQTFSTKIAETNRIKMMAIQALHVTDAFWEEWHIFEKGALALNGILPRFDVVQLPDLGVLMAGVDMASHIRQEKYSDEICRYTAAVLLSHDVHYAPAPLDYCSVHLSQPKYTCSDCDKTGSALPPWDGLCCACVERYEHEFPLSFKPSPEAIAKGHGKNVNVNVTFDPEPVKKRFEEMQKLSPDQAAAELEKNETSETIQAMRLLVATDYMKHKNQQLTDQLSSLRNWLEQS